MANDNVERRIVMGLGEAVLRLIHVERMYADGVDPGEFLINERNLIVEALNEQFKLDLGMDCDGDGIPDAIDDVVEIRDIGIFKASAETSCCRIIPEGVKSRTKTVTVSRKKAPKPVEEEPPTQALVEPLPEPAPKPKKSASRKTSTSRKKAKEPAKEEAPKKGGFFGSIFGSEK